ncbi:MAG: phosphate signaling complex protein PhoU [Candidatus Cloacimonetes bacterium]|nr:phosphate signaling complex protein PhoU [Candidatus Cloacimonadota bacterium]
MLEQKLTELKRLVASEADLALLMLEKAENGLFSKNPALFAEVIAMENKLNTLEMEVEDDAISLMALHQPEAKNLRTIVMLIKMNNDLERIGDHVINITKCASRILERSVGVRYVDLPIMFKETQKMLKDAITSFTSQDTELAGKVLASDDFIDDLRNQIFRVNMTHMLTTPETTPVRMQINEISSHLERIADLTTNLCEEVIFMEKGRVVKHNVTKPR